MKRGAWWALAALGLLLAAPAGADPFTAVGALAAYGSAAAGTATFLGLSASAWFYVGVAATVLGAANARRKTRKAAAAARAEYNAGLQDRTVSVLRTDPPWQVVYGRCIVGGAYTDIITTDKVVGTEVGGTRTKPDGYKTLVLVLAAHEVEAIHEIYIDGVAVGAVDGEGWAATGSPFFSTVTDARIMEFTDELTFTEGPLVEVFSAYAYGGTVDQTPVNVTIESGNRLVSPLTGVPVVVNFSFTLDYPVVRIEKNLGADDQATSAVLADLVPSRYTSDHRLRGCANVVVTVDLEDVRFQGGPPNITADVSGRKVFDPRDDSTAWSSNPALCIRDYLLAPWGYEVATGDIDDDSVSAAADACDELIDLDLGGTVTEDQPRYTCNGAFQTGNGVEVVLENLVDSMAGAVFPGAQWRVMAGTWTEPVLALEDDDLIGQIDVVQSDTPMGALFNGVRGQLMLAGAQSPSDFNPYQSATFATSDGRSLWTDTTLPFIDSLARARNWARIAVESNRAGQVIRYPAKLKAWPVQVGDRVTVTSSELGVTDKPYRTTDWDFDLQSAVVLTLQEDAEEVYDLADAAVADPTPNTDLVDPWSVPALQNVTATSGAATRLLQADGTVVPRVLVEWDAITNGGVTNGGSVEVLWRSQMDPNWTLSRVDGQEVQAYLYGATSGDVIIIKARGRNALGRLGPASFVVHTVEGDSAPPEDVTGLAGAIKPGQVVISCDPCIAADYAATELRYLETVPDYDSGDWDAATFLVRGASNEYKHARPPNGTYYVLAKHLDRSGNYSVNPAYVTIVVDDSIDAYGVALLRLTTDRFPVFSFADGTTHTTTTPDLVITALLAGVVGTATFSAVAYDAADAVIGPVTLATDGNVATLTGAAFVAPGTSGSVRRVRVTGQLSGASDFLDVYRDDPTVVVPRIYLSNPAASVPTDEAGQFGDYSDASTLAVLYEGGADVTGVIGWTWSITPDSGMTATINGGAGPVAASLTISVAVSNSTIDDGVVLISVTDGVDTYTAPFRVSKRKAVGGSGYRLYFEPRTEITLPVRADGTVSSFADARTNVRVVNAAGLDMTAQWDLSRTDVGVTSTLTSNVIQITGFLPLGSLGSLESAAVPAPTDWQRASSATWAEDTWVLFGYHDSAEWSTVLRSADLLSFAEVDMGTDGTWNRGAFGAGKLVAIEAGVAASARIMRSADKGASWTLDTISEAAEQAHVHFGDAFLVTFADTATGSRSADADTWADVTMPAAGCALAFAAPAWAAVTPAGALHTSVDSGATWSTSRNSIMGIPAGHVVARAVGFLGAIAAAFDGPTNLVSASVDGGATWFRLSLPGDYEDPEALHIVRGVLYLISGDGAVYCTANGINWFEGSSAYTAASLPDSVYGAPDSIDVDYLPGLTLGAAEPDPYAHLVTMHLDMTGTDGSTTVLDLAEPTRVLTCVGNAQIDDAIPGGGTALVLDGSGDYLSSNNITGLRPGTGAFTLEVIVRPTSHTGSPYIYSTRSTSPYTEGIIITLSAAGVPGVVAWNAAGTQIVAISGGSAPVDTRTAIEVSRDGSNVWRLAVGGAIVASVTAAGDVQGGTLRIGRSGFDTGDLAGWVVGARMTLGVARNTSTFTPLTTLVPPSSEDLQQATRQLLAATSATDGGVRVLGERAGELPLQAVLPVRLGVPRRTLYTATVSPPWLSLPATSDGVVTDYSNAVFTVALQADGVPDTDNWSITWTTEHLTPSSGSGAVATITAMDPAEDAGRVFFVAEKPGEQLIEGVVDVVKDKSGVASGPTGVAMYRISVGATYMAIRINGDGTWALKIGSGGSFVVQGQWAGAVRPENEDYWVRMQETAGDPFTSGTIDTFLALTTDREWVFEDVTSGVHVCSYAVTFASSSAGADAVQAFGSLQLEVP